MLKWTRRILLFLLLGAIVNVAVAWGLAAANVRHLGRVFYLEELCWCAQSEDDERHYIHLLERIGFDRVIPAASGRVIRRNSATEPSEIPEYKGPIWWEAENLYEIYHMQFASGWPALSLHAHYGMDLDSRRRSALPTGDTVIRPQWNSAIDLSRWSGAPASLANVVLPLRVLPMGVALNTAFYGAVLLLFATAISAARSAMRRRRGLCPACAYPRGSSPVCTECGAPLQC